MGHKQTTTALAKFLLELRAQEASGFSDGQLLRKFVGERDEAAFAALVKRHGPMVFGVCRRILRNVADAEDAFQATFLVLVRKAASLKSRAVVGDWLHGVARRTALKARDAVARRSAKEQAMARPLAQGKPTRDDWLSFLDEELSNLPEKYRLPIVLCDLEGRTRQEAAKHLGWPEGTVAGRLARGRAMLSKRLVRRGITFSAGGLAVALPGSGVTASAPAGLAFSTIKAAILVAAGQMAAEGALSAKVAVLTGDVMKALLLTKLKNLSLVLIVCALGGVGWATYGSVAEEPNGSIPQAVRIKPVVNVPDTKRAERKVAESNESRNASGGDSLGIESNSLVRLLREPIDIRFIENPMTLNEFFCVLYDLYQAKGKELPIVIDVTAFNPDKDEIRDGFQVYDTVLKFPRYPKTLRTETLLNLALAQITRGKAAVLIRDGIIHITTEKCASTSHLLQERVIAQFENRPVSEIVQDLTGLTGVSINIDARVEEKAKAPITVVFRNDVTLAGALRIISDMIGLKMVDMQSGVYITTPANARELEKELREAKK